MAVGPLKPVSSDVSPSPRRREERRGGVLTKERVKALAQEVGFDACGITLPKPIPEAEEVLKKWLEDGKHGEMQYLQNYESRRERFWERLGGAKSVIVLGVNYYSNTCHSERSEKSRLSFPHAFGGNPRVRGAKFIDPRLKHSGMTDSSAYGLRMTEVPWTGRVARYAWGRDYHHVISEKLEILKQRITAEAGHAIHFESAVDTKPLLERSLAQRAGLGFFGKQTQLLSLQFGPWLFLSELITDLELEPDEPFSGSCGSCRICIDECPTDAIEETGGIDARKCIAYLTIEHKSGIPVELRSSIGTRLFGCDECLNVCPYTAKQKETRWTELRAEAGFGPEIDLFSLFEIKSNREYRRKFRASAVLRANRKQLLRNACVVLGNTGSEEALPLLRRALHDSSNVVREHARWAIDRILSREGNGSASTRPVPLGTVPKRTVPLGTVPKGTGLK